MKGCIFGNSHSAALLKAWREHEGAWPGLSLDFFVRSGVGVQGHRLDGPVIRAEDPDFRDMLEKLGLHHEIDLSGYDFLAVVGSEISPFKSVAILRDNQIFGWRTNDLARPVISEKVLRAALADSLRAANGARLLAQLRAVFQADKPIYVLTQPFPAAKHIDSPKLATFRRQIRQGDATRFARLYNEVAATVVEELGGLYLPQPQETVFKWVLTREKFTMGAPRLTNLRLKQAQDDILHANADYGQVVLNDLAGRLGLAAASVPVRDTPRTPE
ncbi:hypothetical protein ACFQXB_01170 [Plastorhodobacter daqingensis]|uniref:Uncharacterized protein n=1 Tax=Plastorhodobacter daqingensis TaxID=1387281 RepID=A0ABW2UDS2_9RHOB